MDYDQKLYELSNKYVASLKDYNLRNIDYVLKEYGSMENFKMLYLEGRLSGKDLNFAKRILRRVLDIDSQFSENQYDNLYSEFCFDSSMFYIYSSREFKDVLEKMRDYPIKMYSLSEKYLEVMELRYLSPNKLSFAKIGKKMGILPAKVQQMDSSLKVKIAKRLRNDGYLDFYSFNSIKSNKMLTHEEKREVKEIEDYIISSDILWINIPINEKDREVARRLKKIIKRIKEREKVLLGNNGEITQLEKLKDRKMKKFEIVNGLKGQVVDAEELLNSYNDITDRIYGKYKLFNVRIR